jgi:hypothetical protein
LQPPRKAEDEGQAALIQECHGCLDYRARAAGTRLVCKDAIASIRMKRRPVGAEQDATELRASGLLTNNTAAALDLARDSSLDPWILHRDRTVP